MAPALKSYPSNRNYRKNAMRQAYQGGRPVAYRGAVNYAPTSQRAMAYTAALAAQETKYFDTSFAGAITFNAGDWSNSEVPCSNYVTSNGTNGAYTDSCLIPTANGSGYGQVTGTRYKLKKLRIRGILRLTDPTTQTLADGHRWARLLLVEDSQPSGSQAQGEDVLQDVGTQENMASFLRIPNGLGRFRILKDKQFILKPSTAVNNAGVNTVSTAYEAVKFKMNFSPRLPVDVNIKANNATPAIAGTINKNYFMLLGCVGPSGTAVALSIVGACRAYYID